MCRDKVEASWLSSGNRKLFEKHHQHHSSQSTNHMQVNATLTPHSIGCLPTVTYMRHHRSEPQIFHRDEPSPQTPRSVSSMYLCETREQDADESARTCAPKQAPIQCPQKHARAASLCPPDATERAEAPRRAASAPPGPGKLLPAQTDAWFALFDCDSRQEGSLTFHCAVQ